MPRSQARSSRREARSPGVGARWDARRQIAASVAPKGARRGRRPARATNDPRGRASVRRRRRCGARARRAPGARRAERRSSRRSCCTSLPCVAVTRPPRPGDVPVRSEERTRWHWTVPSSVPRNGLPLGAMSPEQRRLAHAMLRASTSAVGYRKALDIMALQGVLRRLNTGISDPFDPECSTSRSSAPRRPGLGLAVRRAPPLEALHRRRQHRRRRAVLPRRLADPGEKRVSLGREERADDAPRGGRRARDRALARPRAPRRSCSRRSR